MTLSTPATKPATKPATTPAQTTRIASYGIVLDGDQILLCRLSAAASSHVGRWTLPGGGLEFGEHPEVAMVREVLEETGFEVRPTSLLGIDSYTLERPEGAFQGIRVIYTTEVLGGTLRHEVVGTTDMCQWHPLAAVDNLEVVDLVTAALRMHAG
jgi:8-oxo-dGTP diphosphatase